MDITIRIAGEAGQGLQTTGNLLVGAFAAAGLHVLATQSYMSRIRGGLNWFDIRTGDCELFAGSHRANLLVCLSAAALELLRQDMGENGLILMDAETAEGAAAIPFTKTAKELTGSAVMANSVAAGAIFNILGYDIAKLEQYLAKQFKKKGEQVIRQNVDCARRGAALAKDCPCSISVPQPAGAPDNVYAGGELVGLSAAVAGVKFVSAYPMTPSTATFQTLASLGDEFGILVEQAEDEIAAMNMVIGASYAGAPSMTTTSGGGFALMVEGVSLAAMTETPVLVLVGMRPGPATGLPTRTAQQDLKFVLNAGHGEFVRAIFAPGTHQQCYGLTSRALETACRYQTPVFLLSDQFLQDMQKNLPPMPRQPKPVDKCLVQAGPDYRRYAVTESGISPRAVPGGEGLVVVDSDEHDEAGHIIEDLQQHLTQQDKRMRKGAGLAAEALAPELYGPADARTLLICWGSTYGPCREAVDILNADGGSAAMLHFAQVWPLNADAARNALGRRQRVCCVEGNCTGQFAGLLREQAIIGDCELVLRYDGLPFTGQEIASRIR